MIDRFGVSPYNPDMVKRMIMEALQEAPRGAQTRLAKAAGVGVQAVNKWAQGQTAPEPDRWPAVEEFFGWEPGRISNAAWGSRRASLELPDGSSIVVEGTRLPVGDKVFLLIEMDPGDPVRARLEEFVNPATAERLVRLEEALAALNEQVAEVRIVRDGLKLVPERGDDESTRGDRAVVTPRKRSTAAQIAAKSGKVVDTAKVVAASAETPRKRPSRPKPPAED